MNSDDNDRHQRFQEHVRRLAKAVEAEMKVLQATDRMPASLTNAVAQSRRRNSTNPPRR
jgi:hypothetical protein